MKEISKIERNWLENNGCVFNVDLFKTHSKHPKYYLVESEKNRSLLKKYRDSISKEG